MNPAAIADKVHGRSSGEGQWEARCPAHEDQVRSLSVGTGRDGRTLLVCHAGCDTESIVSALGLLMEDLMPEREQSDDLGRPDAVYPYTDEKGELLFEVLRFPGKKFRQRAADGSWSLKGVRRVPYHLPQLMAAVKAGYPVLVVEGEKDVHSAEAIGQPATTAPGGAGKWDDGWAFYFKGAQVVVVADKDESGVGLAHARQVLESIKATASQVWLAEAADGKDLTDHLAAGFNINELRYLPTEPAVAAVELAGRVMFPDEAEDLAFDGELGALALEMADWSQPSPEAILLSLYALVGVESIGPYVRLGSSEQRGNLYVVVVADAGVGKGQSWAPPAAAMKIADPAFMKSRVRGHFGSGEALIDFVSPTFDKDGNEVGETDIRLMYHMQEMAGTLATMQREGATLGAVLRQGWDGGALDTSSRQHGAKVASQSHIAVVAHITPADLAKMDPTTIANGFGSRFLICMARRVRHIGLGDGPPPEVVEEWGERLRPLLGAARRGRELRFDPGFKRMWDRYDEDVGDATASRPHPLDTLLARLPVQALRLAVIRASSESRDVLTEDDARTAIAITEYAKRSAEILFGVGNIIDDAVPQLSAMDKRYDILYRALEEAGDAGLSRKDIQHVVFKRNITAAEISDLLRRMETNRDGHWEKGGGRGDRFKLR